MNKKNNSGLKKIYSDNTSGSSDILVELHEHLKKEQKMLEVFPELINEVKIQFTAFHSVQSYLNELEKVMRSKKRIDNFFEKYDSRLINIYDVIFDKCKTILLKHKKFITLSNSKTVFEIFKKLKQSKHDLEVTACESRPKFEGRLLAKKLADEGMKINLITDAGIEQVLDNIDAALIGADTILKNGNVVNKTGSAILAVLCKYRSIPFYVVADKNKISNKYKFGQKEMPADEILRKHHPNIKIENLYFEEVNRKLITKIFID